MFKKITKQYSHKFIIAKDGLYSINLEASCKSGKILGIFGGEDLRVEIGDLKLREIPAKNKAQYYNIPPAWNGTKLKGLPKTIIFILKLNKGNYVLKFIPRKGAKIEKKPIINLIKNNELILNNQARDGDKRPWITLALIDLKLKILDVSVKCEKRKRDSDDVKIIIDNKVQENKQSSWWGKQWYFRGSQLQGKTEEARFYPKLSKDIHYIDFWADRMPVLNWIKMDMGIKLVEKLEKKKKEENIKAKVIWKIATLRKKPKQKDQNILQEINKGSEVFILEKAIRGERPKNSKGVLLSSNRWHKVQYQNKKGYIYSEGLEIEGENKDEIQKMVIKAAKEQNINPEVLLALAECEAKFFPYTVSYNFNNPKIEVAFGVMQLSKPLIIDFNDKKKNYYSPISNVFDLEQNIKAGATYFSYLNKIYKNDKERLEKSIAAYNSGPGNVDLDSLLDLDLYEGQTQRLVKCVKAHLKNKIFKKILSKAGILISFMFISFILLYFVNNSVTTIFSTKVNAFENKPITPFLKGNDLPTQYKNYRIIKQELVDVSIDLNGGDQNLRKKIVVINNDIDSFLSIGFSKILLIREDGYFIELPGWGEGFQWWEVGNLNGNSSPDIAILYQNSGNGSYNHFYFYEWNGYNFEIKLQNKNFHNNDELVDLDNDGIFEIVHNFGLYRWTWGWKEIFKWDKKKQNFVKANHLFPSIYKKWLSDKEPNLNIVYENPPPEYFENPEWKTVETTNNCLKEKATLSAKSIFADIDDCY